jgi:hypothetical protein
MQLKALFQAAVGYVRKNPDEVVKAAINAATLRFGVPLAALRYFALEASNHSDSAQSARGPRDGASSRKSKMPKDIELGSAPPALRLSATVDAMGTNLRASANVKVDEVVISPDTLRIGIRLTDVKVALIGESDSPVATLVKSGALDLSKPGNLVKFIPKRPAAIVESDGDRIVVDLMKVPQLAANERLRRVLAILTPLVGIRGIETDRDHVYVMLRATPRGLLQAIEAIRTG